MNHTKKQHLLFCLIEECSEIQKVATKALRFGLEDRHPHVEDAKINKDLLEEEIIDLLAVMKYLIKEKVIFEDTTGLHKMIGNNLDGIKAKIAKIDRYMKYSKIVEEKHESN